MTEYRLNVWGSNTYGQLGQGDSNYNQLNPVYMVSSVENYVHGSSSTSSLDFLCDGWIQVRLEG